MSRLSKRPSYTASGVTSQCVVDARVQTHIWNSAAHNVHAITSQRSPGRSIYSLVLSALVRSRLTLLLLMLQPIRFAKTPLTHWLLLFSSNSLCPTGWWRFGVGFCSFPGKYTFTFSLSLTWVPISFRTKNMKGSFLRQLIFYK